MATALSTLVIPAEGADYREKTGHRRAGLALGVVGLGLATITLIASIVAAQQLSDGEEVASTLAWSFGLTTTAFSILKFGIAVILVGILVRLWFRWDSMGVTLPKLKGSAEGKAPVGDFESPFGPALATDKAPKELPIHKMARTLWAPMLAMGAMAVAAGLVVSIVWANQDVTSATGAAAWTQGLQFLGEAFILSGISFLLGSIVGLIRKGGGEVQESLGLTVKTLKMPVSAKLFVVLMMAGLLVGVAQFIGYLFVASLSDLTQVASNFAWLGPFRELGLGLLLAGIVLALASIARALGFQAWRVREIITTGQ